LEHAGAGGVCFADGFAAGADCDESSDLRRHPAWLLAVAMVHHPLLAAVGIFAGGVAVLIYIRWARLPSLAVADCLAAPIALGIAAEQVGALLAGSDFGRESAAASELGAVTYSSALAARWSGTPLGVAAVYPVQAYAALERWCWRPLHLSGFFCLAAPAMWLGSG
jgi:prolipoprotein diacylglyceryltransferase